MGNFSYDTQSAFPLTNKNETVKTTSIAILSAAALAASAQAAQPAKAIKPAVPANQAVQIEPSHLSHDVKVLASDEFEGRGPNTPGEVKTVAYLVNQFEAAGLKPGGDLVDGKRGWTQDVPLGSFEIKGPVAVTVKGGGKEETLTQGEQIAVRALDDGREKRRLQGRAAGLRRLRRQRAGTQMGRLQGRWT